MGCDLAKEKPELIARAEVILKSAREDHPDWPLRDRPAGKGKAKK
jgi:hypothetical protein